MDVRKFVNDLVFGALDKSRGFSSPNVFASLLPLYAYRYGLKIRVESRIDNFSLSLLDAEDELFGYINHLAIGGITKDSLSDIVNGLRQVDKPTYDEAYPLIVDDIISRFELNAGKSMSIMGQPSELTELISHLIIREGCKSIYNPFAGLASYATRLKGICQYHGQELNLATGVLAQIRLKAHDIDITAIEAEDSIQNWNPGNADCIVATPPFGLRLAKGQAEGHDNAESFCIDAALRSNADTAIFVVRSGFGFKNSGSDFSMRKSLCEPDSRLKVKYVIDLPDNIFVSTGIPTTILVLKATDQQENPVFVDASLCFSKPRHKKVLDVEKILELIESKPDQCVATVENSVLFNNGCSFSSKLYVGSNIALNPGEMLVKMSSIFEVVRNRIPQGLEGVIVDRALMSSDWYDSLLNKNQAKKSNGEKSIFGVSEPCIILSYFNDALKLYIHDSRELLILKPFQCAVRVIDETLTLDYAALLLLKDKNIQRYPFDIVGLDHLGMDILCRTQTITVLENDRDRNDLMQKIKQETSFLRSEEEKARQSRLGISKLSSDISHMLGTTMSNSQDIIADIHDMKTSDAGYEDKVQALIDCINKTFRVIKYSGANLADNEFSIEEFSIHEYLNAYVRAWKSYGSKCFALDVINEVSKETLVNADRTMLDIQLDTILDNAKKHGFGNKKQPSNQVSIEVSAVSYKERKFVQLRVSNNGKPMRADMTMEDFISASRYRVDSGRLSQGGNHIYTIAKKNGGFFFLGTDTEDKMFIDVLIPAIFPDNEAIYEYDRECI